MLPFPRATSFLFCLFTLRVGVVLRAANLVQPEPHQSQIPLARRDCPTRSQAYATRNPVADPRRIVECEFADDRTVGRTEEFLRGDGVERVASLGSGQARTVQGVEGGRGRPGVAAQEPETEAAHHR